jgi:hypothetical protein
VNPLDYIREWEQEREQERYETFFCCAI